VRLAEWRVALSAPRRSTSPSSASNTGSSNSAFSPTGAAFAFILRTHLRLAFSLVGPNPVGISTITGTSVRPSSSTDSRGGSSSFLYASFVLSPSPVE